MTIAIRVFLEIILMIALPPLHNFSAVPLQFESVLDIYFVSFQCRFNNGFILFVLIINARAILSATIIALLIDTGWVDNTEIILQQFYLTKFLFGS